MLRFLGYDLELAVETSFAGGGDLSLFTARDIDGAPWLIAQVSDDPSWLAWLCAPVSERALQVLLERVAEPRDVFRHSRTGTVELVAVEGGRATPDICLLCQDLPEDILAGVGPIASLAG